MKDYQYKLFPYAYNILGSSEDAKDAVQDVLVKHFSSKNKNIKNVKGYLIKSVVNQAINIKKRNAKITADTIWLPEPLATEKTDDTIISEEIISYSMLVLLERLTPKERAVFILKEAFNYSHKEIAETINATIENSRKLLSRAKLKLEKLNPKKNQNYSPNTSSYMQEYIDAIKNGEVEKLEKMLTEDISLAADGGGEVRVVRELTLGKRATLDLLLFVYKTYQRLHTIKIAEMNHQPALLFYENDILVACQVFELDNSKIRNVYAVLALNKLKSIL
ncbi:MAG: sigma-70 family RNA polymerase sigma factor [Cellulophaga sp.]